MPPRKYLILEVPKDDLKPLGSDKEIRSSITALEHHLGFQEILRRLRLAKAVTQSRLNNEEHPNVEGLRALIKAFGFVEQQLKLELGRPQATAPREAFEDERLEYERVAKALQIIGQAN